MSDKLNRWKSLNKEINNYNKKYRIGQALIDDDYYDELKSELELLQDELGIHNNLNIIQDPVNGPKVKHSYPLLSLDHGFGEEAVHNFIKKRGDSTFPIIVEHKIDGISLAIRYIDGKLNQIITRGNGVEGMNVTEKLSHLQIPRQINYSHDLEVRGEMYTTFEQFQLIKDKFASPRNYCASFVHSKNQMYIIPLFFAIHDCINFPCTDYLGLLHSLQNLGFPFIWHKIAHTTDEIVHILNQVVQNRAQIEYPIDGIVLKINNMEIRQRLGSHLTAPRYACAIKIRANNKQTTIRDIQVSVGKFGTVTPVALFDPIFIDGNKLSRASMHNVNELKKNRYGIGDRIIVERAGDSVPQIISKIYDNHNPFLIALCPSCNSNLIDVNNGLLCPNSWQCPGQKIARIRHFCSRNAANIDGISTKKIQQLVELNLINNPIDFFALKLDHLKCVRGWDKKSINNLHVAIKRAVNIKLANFLYGICIPNVGYGTAVNLAKYYHTFSNFLLSINKEEVQNVPNIGAVTLQSIKNFINSDLEKWIYRATDYLKI